MTKLLPGLVGLTVLAIWQLYAELGSIDPLLLPGPDDVATSLYEDRGRLADDLLVTGGEIVIGLAIALLVGTVVAVALHLVAPLKQGLSPWLIASQAVPVVLFAPVLVAWFGFGWAPKLTIVAIVCFFPLTVAILDGLAAADPDQRKLLRSLGASRTQLLRWVELPSALPRAFTGARLSVAFAAVAAYLAESSGSDSGLGHLIDNAIPQLETARAWAAVVVLSLFVLALYGALSLAERRLVPWARPLPIDRRP